MKTVVAVLLFCFAPPLSGDQPATMTVTKENVGSFYKFFTRLTKNPILVPHRRAIACGNDPSPEQIAREKAENGPHYDALIHIYASVAAEETMARRRTVFPAGSVIVKEKLARDGSVAGVGGMVKREPGYDTKNGDWEYFYSDKATGFAIGRLENCSTCHASPKTTDHVFSALRFQAIETDINLGNQRKKRNL